MVYQHTIHIDAPIGEVFEFFRDPGNFRRLHPGIEFTDITLTEDGVGTHYSWTSRVAGIKLAGCDVYTEFIPNRRITDRSSSALEGTWRYTFEAAGPGTQLTLSNQVAVVLGLAAAAATAGLDDCQDARPTTGESAEGPARAMSQLGPRTFNPPRPNRVFHIGEPGVLEACVDGPTRREAPCRAVDRRHGREVSCCPAVGRYP